MKKLLLCFVLLSNLFYVTEAKAFNPTQDIITFQKYPDVKQMKEASDLIGYGEIGAVLNKYDTHRTVSQGKLFNFVQRYKITQGIKGKPQTVSLMITGVEPLPSPRDPINAVYPGPLASGHYIMFLNKIDGTPYYRMTGGWQGIYPVIQGTSIALYNEGFPELNRLTPEQFRNKIQSE